MYSCAAHGIMFIAHTILSVCYRPTASSISLGTGFSVSVLNACSIRAPFSVYKTVGNRHSDTKPVVAFHLLVINFHHDPTLLRLDFSAVLSNLSRLILVS